MSTSIDSAFRQVWWPAFRPRTLTAAVVPIAAGTALAGFHGFDLRWWIPVLALLASIFIQIGTNLVNDAVDFFRGADREDRLGPRRITQAGLVSPARVLAVAFGFFLAALLCGLPLVLEGGVPILAIGLLSILCGYAYTAGPFPLAYEGLGDLFVILFFGVVAVCGLYFLLTGQWCLDALVLGLQVGFHCAVLIAINNLRDVRGDARAGKKTLPVRFGVTFARYEIGLLLLMPFLINFYWWKNQALWAAVLGFLALPLALSIAWKIFTTEPSPIYNQFLGQSALVHLSFGLMTSLGLILCL